LSGESEDGKNSQNISSSGITWFCFDLISEENLRGWRRKTGEKRMKIVFSMNQVQVCVFLVFDVFKELEKTKRCT
jgi:hypothetical protein